MSAIAGTAAAGLIACGGDDSSSGGTTPTSTTTNPPPPPNNPPPPPPPNNPPPPPPVDAGPTMQAATPTFAPMAGMYTTAQQVTISSTTAGATIYFTLDGTNPTHASVVYGTPIAITTNTTIRAIASAAGFADSAVGVAAYVINIPPGTTAPVSFNPPAGNAYPNTQSVGLSSATVGATICYTIDGSSPAPCAAGVCGMGSQTYNGALPIQVAAPETIKALACKSGNTDSTVTSASYNFKAAAAQSDTPNGNVALNQQVVLSSVTAGATVHYTINGAQPDCFSPLTGASSGFPLNIANNETIRTIVCKGGYANSDPATFTYTVQVDAPTLDPGTYDKDHLVVATNPGLSVDADSWCFATGATIPACNAAGTGCATGTATLTVTADNTTVNAVGCKAGFATSNPTNGVYHLKTGAITITPPGDTTSANYWNGGPNQAFTLATSTTGGDVHIRYNTAVAPAVPADPTCTTGTLINANSGGTGTLAPFTTIKAIACKTNYQNSDPRQLTYADPTQVTTLQLAPDPGVVYNNAINATLTPTPSDATVCYVAGQNLGATTVTCDNVSGACGCTGAGCAASATSTGLVSNVGTANINPSFDGYAVKAVACKSGVLGGSGSVNAVYQFQVGAPTFNPNGGGVAYGSSISENSVTTSTGAAAPLPGQTWFVRSWGSPTAVDPSCATATACPGGATPAGTCRQTSAIPVNPGDPSTVSYNFTTAAGAPGPVQTKVIGCRQAYQNSSITTVSFNAGSLADPTISPNGGTFNNVVNGVTIQSTSLSTPPGVPNGILCYTTDGGIPACQQTGPATVVCVGTGNSQQYTGAFNVTTDNTTVRAVTCAPGFPQSNVISANFHLVVGDFTAAVDPAGGPFSTPQSLLFNNGVTNGVTICFTEDGSDIDTACTVGGCSGTYNAGQPFCFLNGNGHCAQLDTNVNLKARACRSGFTASNQQTYNYTFTPYARTITIDGNDDFAQAENQISGAFSPNVGGGPPNNYTIGVGTTGSGTITASNNFYVSWDSGNVYLGYEGDQLTNSSTRWLSFYVRSSDGNTTTTTDDLPGGGAEFNGGTLPVAVNTHFYWRTDGLQSGLRVWNGASWIFPLTPITTSAASGGSLGSSTAYVELAISRTDLGIDGASAFLVATGDLHDTDAAGDDAVFPWRNTATRWGHFTANMSGAAVPSSNGSAFTGPGGFAFDRPNHIVFP